MAEPLLVRSDYDLRSIFGFIERKKYLILALSALNATHKKRVQEKYYLLFA